MPEEQKNGLKHLEQGTALNYTYNYTFQNGALNSILIGYFRVNVRQD